MMKQSGVYLPPHKLRQLQEQQTASTTFSQEDFQRQRWEELKKNINSLVNKANIGNIEDIVFDLFKLNLVRGRGLLCRALIQAQAVAPNFSNVYAAIVAVINTKIPDVGNLLLRRLVMMFRRTYRRNDKINCTTVLRFIAHLVNQQVADELLALQLLHTFLENPTSDSVILAVDFMKDCGAALSELSPLGFRGVFEQLRDVLQDEKLDRRAGYAVESLMAIRRKNFEEYPALLPALDLVEADDQIPHEVNLAETHDEERMLDVFSVDEEWQAHEDMYEEVRREILGEDEGEEEEEDGEGEAVDVEGNLAALGGTQGFGAGGIAEAQVSDEAKATELCRRIYLTLMSSLSFEEAVHKLRSLTLEEGQERVVVEMLVKCCANEKTYSKFYGNVAERLCKLVAVYADEFEDAFAATYLQVHQHSTLMIRNLAMLFAHLMYTDAVDWALLRYVTLTEEATTAASRIFLKVLLTELAKLMGVQALRQRLEHPSYAADVSGVFPMGHPRDTRFAVNYLTSIGLGALTQRMREHLQNAPALLAAMAQQGADSDSDSDTGSSGSDTSRSSRSSSSSRSSRSSRSSASSRSSWSSRSRSRSRSPSPSRSRSPSRTRSRPAYRARSYSRSRSPSASPSRSRSRSRSPYSASSRSASRSRARSYSPSRSRSRSRSPSRSPSRTRTRTRTRTYSFSRSRSRSPKRPRARSLSRSVSRSVSPARSRPRSLSPHPPLNKTARPRSRSASPTATRSRSTSASISAPAPASAARKRSLSPPPRKRSLSRSVSRSRSHSASPGTRKRPASPAARKRSVSPAARRRSPSPSPSRSRSRSPRRPATRSLSPSRSPRRPTARSPSRSASPPASHTHTHTHTHTLSLALSVPLTLTLSVSVSVSGVSQARCLPSPPQALPLSLCLPQHSQAR